MRLVILAILCQLLTAAGAAPPAALHEAFRLEAFAGDPLAAAGRYAGALEDPASAPAAGLGLGRCLERLGHRPEAARAFGWALSASAPGTAEEAGALAGIRRGAPAWLESAETAPGSWILSRAEVEEAVAGAFQILGQLKVEPYKERDGRVGGLLLRAVGNGSLVARRGFQPYDILRSVNRRPLTSSGAAEILALLAALKDEPLVEVEIERLGEARTLRFEILRDRDLALRHGPFPKPAPPAKEIP